MTSKKTPLTPEQLQEVENLANLYLSLEDICTILGINQYDYEYSVFETSFNRGRLKREAQIRKVIFQFADSGSQKAQELALKLMENGRADKILAG